MFYTFTVMLSTRLGIAISRSVVRTASTSLFKSFDSGVPKLIPSPIMTTTPPNLSSKRFGDCQQISETDEAQLILTARPGLSGILCYIIEPLIVGIRCTCFIVMFYVTVWIGGFHPRGSLFEGSVDLEGALKQHQNMV